MRLTSQTNRRLPFRRYARRTMAQTRQGRGRLLGTLVVLGLVSIIEWGGPAQAGDASRVLQGPAPMPAAVIPATISAGNAHTCGVQTDGTVACWGLNDFEQAPPPNGTFTQVRAGSFHTCGVQTDGSVACWGSDASGQAPPPTQ